MSPDNITFTTRWESSRWHQRSASRLKKSRNRSQSLSTRDDASKSNTTARDFFWWTIHDIIGRNSAPRKGRDVRRDAALDGPCFNSTVILQRTNGGGNLVA